MMPRVELQAPVAVRPAYGTVVANGCSLEGKSLHFAMEKLKKSGLHKQVEEYLRSEHREGMLQTARTRVAIWEDSVEEDEFQNNGDEDQIAMEEALQRTLDTTLKARLEDLDEQKALVIRETDHQKQESDAKIMEAKNNIAERNVTISVTKGSLETARPVLSMMETYNAHSEKYGFGAYKPVAFSRNKFGLNTEDDVVERTPTKQAARDIAWGLVTARVHANQAHDEAPIENVDRIDRMRQEPLRRFICNVLKIGIVDDPVTAAIERARVETERHLKREREPLEADSAQESPVAKRLKMAADQAGI